MSNSNNILQIVDYLVHECEGDLDLVEGGGRFRGTVRIPGSIRHAGDALEHTRRKPKRCDSGVMTTDPTPM